MQNQAAHSSSSRKHFLQLKKLSSFPKEGRKEGIFVAMFSTITEIGHILFLKEMDHSIEAPTTHPGLPPSTRIHSAWSIPTSLPNSLTNTLILYVHVSFHLFHMLFMPFTFTGRGCEMTPHGVNLPGFEAVLRSHEGKAEQLQVWGLLPEPRVHPAQGRVVGVSPAGCHSSASRIRRKKHSPAEDLWWDCWCRRLCTQINNNDEADVM